MNNIFFSQVLLYSRAATAKRLDSTRVAPCTRGIFQPLPNSMDVSPTPHYVRESILVVLGAPG